MTFRVVSWRRVAVAVAVALALATPACGRPAAPPPLVPVPRAPGPPPDACVLASDSTAPPAALRIAVPDVPRFVQRQVYETLIRIDCTGAPVPALAQSWISGDDGRQWTFTLRSGARFSDGTPLTAADVFAALARDSSLLDRSAITLDGIDRVSVRFSAARASVPPLFAEPGLAVTRRGASSGWLVGSGVATADTAAGAATVTPSAAAAARPIITVRPGSGGDVRDLLDHGIDILVSGDPEVLSYAAGRSELRTVPLPWDRAYVLLSASPPTIPDTVRMSLARDVVRMEARSARGSYWWLAGPACPGGDTATVTPAMTGTRAATVVYYPQSDAPARDLAERLVALGLLGPGGRAAGVAAADFGPRVAAGGDSYLVSLPREALAPCGAVRDLVTRAPWLSTDPSRHITALVETRERAIVRRGGSAFTVDWDGTLRVR